MLEFLASLVISSALLMLAAYFVKGIEIENWGAAFLGALVLGIINATIAPVLKFLTFPITILTLGLSLLAINALMLMLVSAIVPGIKIKGCASAFLGAILLAVLNVIVHHLTD